MHQNKVSTNWKYKLLIQIGVPENSKRGISQSPDPWQTYTLKPDGLIEKPSSHM